MEHHALIAADPLVELAIIWIGVLVAVYLAKRTRLTPVLYYLAIGAFFVNIGLLPTEIHTFIRNFAEVGIILIMFALGFEERVDSFLSSVKKSWGIAFFGALVPFVVAYVVADYFWNDMAISVMTGLCMTATAVSLTMVALRIEGLHRTVAATRIMTSALLDDIASLILVAMLVPIAVSHATPELWEILVIAAKAAAFFVGVALVGAWILPQPGSGLSARIPFLNRFGIKHVLSFDDSKHTTLIVLIFALSAALASMAMGFHPAVGAYMAGLILREEYFKGKDGTGHFRATRRIIDNVAFSWIGPVFFVTLGTELVFDWQILVSVVPHVLFLTSGILIGQVLSAAIAARYSGGLDKPNSILVGVGMLGRAELAFVVLDIAHIQHPILPTEAIYALMGTAFCLNVAVPVSIRLWKKRYGVQLE